MLKQFLFFLGVVFAIFSIWKLLHAPALQDFTVYYTAAQDFLHHQNPYINPNNNYIYPPGSLFLIAPIGFFPYSIASVLWSVFSILALAASFLLLTQLLFGEINSNQHWQFFLVIFLLSWTFFPLKFSLGMGQLNVFVLFLCVLTFFLWQKNFLKLAGVFLGIAITLKLFPIFFALFFMRKKNWTLLGVAASVFLLTQLLILPWYSLANNSQTGMTTFGYYFTTVIHQTVGGLQNTAYYNQSIVGFLARISTPPQITNSIQIVTAIIFFLFSFLMASPKRESAATGLLELSLFVLSWLITERVSWQHYFIFAFIPLATLLFCYCQNYFEKVSLIFPTLLLISFFLIGWNIKNTGSQFWGSAFIYSHVLWGTVLLFCLTAFQLVISSQSNAQRQLPPHNPDPQP